jgi:hypothetical protein
MIRFLKHNFTRGYASGRLTLAELERWLDDALIPNYQLSTINYRLSIVGHGYRTATTRSVNQNGSQRAERAERLKTLGRKTPRRGDGHALYSPPWYPCARPTAERIEEKIENKK